MIMNWILISLNIKKFSLEGKSQFNHRDNIHYRSHIELIYKYPPKKTKEPPFVLEYLRLKDSVKDQFFNCIKQFKLFELDLFTSLQIVT